MAVILANVVSIPASIQGAIVVRVGLLMRFHCHIRRAHYALAQVVDAVEIVRMVITLQLLGHASSEGGVDAPHHEQAVELVRHRSGEEGICGFGAPTCANCDFVSLYTWVECGEQVPGIIVFHFSVVAAEKNSLVSLGTKAWSASNLTILVGTTLGISTWSAHIGSLVLTVRSCPVETAAHLHGARRILLVEVPEEDHGQGDVDDQEYHVDEPTKATELGYEETCSRASSSWPSPTVRLCVDGLFLVVAMLGLDFGAGEVLFFLSFRVRHLFVLLVSLDEFHDLLD